MLRHDVLETRETCELPHHALTFTTVQAAGRATPMVKATHYMQVVQGASSHGPMLELLAQRQLPPRHFLLGQPCRLGRRPLRERVASVLPGKEARLRCGSGGRGNRSCRRGRGRGRALLGVFTLVGQPC